MRHFPLLSISSFPLLVMGFLLSSGPFLKAQGVTVKAIAFTELKAVWFDPFSGSGKITIPALTDITNGARLGSYFDFSTDHQPTRSTFSLKESGFRTYWGRYGWGLSTVGPHTVQVEYKSPVPFAVQLTLTRKSGNTGGAPYYIGKAEMMGYGALVANQPIPAIIDKNGLYIRISTSGSACTTLGTASFQENWTITLTPDPNWPCRGTEYGKSWGAALGVSTLFTRPGAQILSIFDSSLPTNGFLLVGEQKLDLKLWSGSHLYNNAVFLFPLSFNPKGSATLPIIPPQIPGLKFFCQGVAIKGSAFNLTKGIEFALR